MTLPLPEPLDLEDLGDINTGLLPSEREAVLEVAAQAQAASTRPQAAKVLLAAFVAYRAYASRAAIAHGLEKVIAGADIGKVSNLIWMGYRPYFALMVKPLFAYEVLKAGKRAKMTIPASKRDKLAQDYADRLGVYFTVTSAAAMSAGFNAMVNRKVARRAAAERAFMAFGLTKRQMLAFVNANFDAKNTSARELNPRRQATRYVIKAFEERARTMGKTEAYVITQEAQQVSWLWQARQGQISTDARKMWITADDERVCPSCGPMHGKSVRIDEYFRLPTKEKVWVPGIHPKCRCRMRLLRLATSEVSKALEGAQLREFNAKHPRRRTGQFAPKGFRDTGLSAAQRARDVEASKPQEELRDTTLKDVGLTDTSLKDVGLKDVGLKDVGIQDVGLKDTGLKAVRLNEPGERVELQGSGLSADEKVALISEVMLNHSRPQLTSQDAFLRTEFSQEQLEDLENDPSRRVYLKEPAFMPAERGYSFIAGQEKTLDDDQIQHLPSGEVIFHLRESDIFMPPESEWELVDEQVHDIRRRELEILKERGPHEIETSLSSETYGRSEIVTAQMTDDDLSQAILSLQHSETLDTSYVANNRSDGRMVEFELDSGEKLERFITYREMADQLGLERNEMLPTMFQVNEMHFNARKEEGSQYGYTSYSSAGRYYVAGESTDEETFPYAVNVVHLKPVD